MEVLNVLSIFVLVATGIAVLAGLGTLASGLMSDDDEGLQIGATILFIGLVAAVVFFAGSFFPGW